MTRKNLLWPAAALLGLCAGSCNAPDAPPLDEQAVAASRMALVGGCDPSGIDENAYYYIHNPRRDRKLGMTSTGWVESRPTSAQDDSVQWKFTRANNDPTQFFIDRRGGDISDDKRRLSCDWLDPEDPAAVGYNSYAVGFKTSKTNKRVTWQLDTTGDGRCWLHCQSSAHPVTGTEPSPPIRNNGDYGTVGSLFMKVDPFHVLVADSTDGNENWNSRKWSLEVVPSGAVCGNGIVEAGEACDDAGEQPGTCNDDCSGPPPPRCAAWCSNHKNAAGETTSWPMRCGWDACSECGKCSGRPNLIVVLADDLGYNDVSFNGSEDIQTPSIDSIANAGVRFTNGYVSFPVCGPSRAGLLTGRYQNRFGFTHNPSIDPNNPDIGIPHDEENIAEVLQKANYESMVIGKWHMGSHPDHHPLNRGFDHFYGFLSGGHRYFPEELTLNDLSEVQNRTDWYYTKIMRDFERVDIDQYLTDEFSDEAVRFIDSQALKPDPFFLYLAYNAPHTPLQATEKYLARFSHIEDEKRKIYLAMVSSVDDGVGRVLDALAGHELLNDTIVVFLSDNGGPESKNASDNGPLRGTKGDLFEGGVRVPFAMQWPRELPAGVDYDPPVSALDILGTIAPLAGVTSINPLDGVNLVPHIKGENTAPPHDRLMWVHLKKNNFAIRNGNTKVWGQRGVDEQWDPAALYDLPNDIGEASNMMSSTPAAEVDALMAPWTQWYGELEGPAFPSLEDDEWWLR